MVTNWLCGAQSVEEHNLANRLAYDDMPEDERRELASTDERLCALALARATSYSRAYWHEAAVATLRAVHNQMLCKQDNREKVGK